MGNRYVLTMRHSFIIHSWLLLKPKPYAVPYVGFAHPQSAIRNDLYLDCGIVREHCDAEAEEAVPPFSHP